MLWIYVQTKLLEGLYFYHNVSSLTEICLQNVHLWSIQLGFWSNYLGTPVEMLILWKIVGSQVLWHCGIALVYRDWSKTRLRAKFSRKDSRFENTEFHFFMQCILHCFYRLLFLCIVFKRGNNASDLGGRFLGFKAFRGSVFSFRAPGF